MTWTVPLSEAWLYVETDDTSDFLLDDVVLVEAGADPPPPPNLLENGDMEDGTTAWDCRWNCQLTSESSDVRCQVTVRGG